MNTPYLPPTGTLDPQREGSLRTIGQISYALHALVAVAALVPGFTVSPLLLIVALVIDMVKREQAVGSWQESHFRWRLRSVIFAGIAYLLTSPLWLLIFPGWIAWTIISAWLLYRVLRGWLALNDGRAIQ